MMRVGAVVRSLVMAAAGVLVWAWALPAFGAAAFSSVSVNSKTGVNFRGGDGKRENGGRSAD